MLYTAYVIYVSLLESENRHYIFIVAKDKALVQHDGFKYNTLEPRYAHVKLINYFTMKYLSFELSWIK
jgi:hypothetical protein